MDLLGSWVAFPALLTALAVGCGAAVEAGARLRLPSALLPVLGLAAMIVTGQFLTLADATAELTAPVIAAVAVAGLVILAVCGRPRPRWWALGAAAGVFAVYAAPIVLSGEATFAGYIRLDDTATWLALTDRVMEHGRSLDGLAPSTYEATLSFNLADGYPIGAFLPLGAGTKLTGIDVAWLIQPYMAWLASVLTLALWSLARRVASAPWRAAIGFVGAQAALLYGYYLWGGVKELAAAVLIAAVVAMAPSLNDRDWSRGAAVTAALPCAALIGVLSAGGALWLVPAFAAAGFATARRLGVGPTAIRALGVTAVVAALSIPVLATGGLLPPTSSPLTDADARGNLIQPLEPAQVAGIWPAGDFRVDPDLALLAYVLIALAILGAAAGLAIAWRRRDRAVVVYVAGTLVAAALIWAVGSPWVDAKALATASPAILFAAMFAAAALTSRSRRLAGLALASALTAGVLWSNALAYRDVNLAPRDRLAELERIGDTIAGEGPTLMTEYEPYGARHFLREGDAEGASELRRRQVFLASGGTAHKGEAVDTDEIDPASLFIYRTLVLRRSPAQSRPPAPYELIWSGTSYEVWQRPPGPPPQIERLPLGSGDRPVAVPGCGRVRALAGGSAGTIVAARRPQPIVAGRMHEPVGAMTAAVRVRRGGDYELWLGGSIRPQVDVRVDEETVGSVRHVLNNQGQYVLLGRQTLAHGAHTIEVDFHGADLHPGSGGAAAEVGPLVLSRAEAADARLVRVASADAERLCGHSWDWIETGA